MTNYSAIEIEKHFHVSISRKSQLDALVKPLFNFTDIKYFGYNRYYKNQKWIGIYTDITAPKIELESGGGPLYVDEKGSILESGTYFHCDLKDLLKCNVSNPTVEKYFAQEKSDPGKKVLTNAVLIVRKGLAYDEGFYFSMMSEKEAARAYFYQLDADLKRYCFYFLQKGKKLIEEAEANRIRYNVFPPEQRTENSSLIKFSDAIDVQKFSVSTDFGDIFLSRQELKCLKLLAKGCQHNDIANVLDIQVKTVESYLENIKNKLSVSTRAEAIAHYEAFTAFENMTI